MSATGCSSCSCEVYYASRLGGKCETKNKEKETCGHSRKSHNT